MFQYIQFQHYFPVEPVSITKIRHVASHQHLVSALPSNICIVTTSSFSTSSSTATSAGIFDPSVTMASLIEQQPVMPLTPSTSFLFDENVKREVRATRAYHLITSHFIRSFLGPTKSSRNELYYSGVKYQTVPCSNPSFKPKIFQCKFIKIMYYVRFYVDQLFHSFLFL